VSFVDDQEGLLAFGPGVYSTLLAFEDVAVTS